MLGASLVSVLQFSSPLKMMVRGENDATQSHTYITFITQLTKITSNYQEPGTPALPIGWEASRMDAMTCSIPTMDRISLSSSPCMRLKALSKALPVPPDLHFLG